MRTGLPAVLACCAALAACGQAGDDVSRPPDWVEAARRAAGELGGSLKSELEAALSDRGPVGAVEVCSVRAPGIAERLSGDGIEVGRTALRVRNPSNVPDAWERSVLEDFRRQIQNGTDPATLEVRTVEIRDGKRVGRWMKAIPTAPLCTTCHGEELAPDLARTIERLYPDDRATGFRPGDLRGAFTVTTELSAHDGSRERSP